MVFLRRLAFALSCFFGVISALYAPACAAPVNWPERPVRILIPFAPGGAADTLARILSDQFASEAKGQPLVVENRPGAGGTLAAAETSRSAPDGYTLLMGDIGANAVAGALFPKLPYDVAKSFEPVIHLANLPMVMIANNNTGDGTLEGFLKLARSKPGGLNYASAGPGGASHLMMELFNDLGGTRIVHVPYRGGAPVLQSVMVGDTHAAFSTVSTSKPFIESKSVRAIAVGGARPIPALPGVPPVAHLVPGFEAYTWHGIHAPAGTSPELVREINRVFNALLGRPEVLKRLEQQTAEPIGGPPEAYSKFVHGEIGKWAKVVATSGIKVD
jgi:tripartite-type tricarboxylate transporter receptor subunit TctC